ncbi:ParA family protein [Azospirillum sp. RWY-5-1]|uniref:ParA family protein n=1 Tax=Azospirillum oleiclasticum TaxID=2735135 RepID=A0ABX2TLB6_9PROT|nr:ParA family protein [Azospirillum oleiclasticum]NYZ18007.1 ParA family protein [Azospirillum oleiclasticum]NYZ25166.1 ParA family protein [Azospirillum oleiclasticum]
MTAVASFASTKGGVGKTSLVMALATDLRRRGRTVLLLDCDPNRHLTEWVRRRDDSGIAAIDEITEANVRQTVQQHAPGYDHTLIDLAGFGNLTMLYAFSVSDVVIIPTQQSYMDVKETVRTFKVVGDSVGVLRHTPACGVVVVRTQAAIQSRVDRHARDLLAEHGVPALKTELIERSLLKEMTYTGRGPGEADPGSNADQNVRALTEEFIGFVAAAPVNPLVARGGVLQDLAS